GTTIVWSARGGQPRIETTRNSDLIIRLSVQSARSATTLKSLDGLFLSNRGIRIPALTWEPSYQWAAGCFRGRRERHRRLVVRDAKGRETIGQSPRVHPTAIALVLILPLLPAKSPQQLSPNLSELLRTDRTGGSRGLINRSPR